MENIEKQDGDATIDYFAELATAIQKAVASGSIKTARDGKTVTSRPWRELRLIPKAKAKHWVEKAGESQMAAFREQVRREPERTYDIEGDPVHAIYEKYLAGCNGYFGGDVLLRMLGLPAMGSTKLEIISNHVDLTGWISRDLGVFGHPPKVCVDLQKKNLRYMMFLDAVKLYFWQPCDDPAPYRILYRDARRWHLVPRLVRKYAKRFYDEEVMADVERIFTIGKTRDHTPPWARRKA
ncbi:hypothetical protein [uncultured Selenomonas sp.]|uniref:hypothetical protein n=1 Tax=uncultured Selenomonas sp. TaxID=159275 RepID=UPI0025F1FF37|nr:hypothetical protein [uncultured Selenomonas sp.]